MAELVARHLDPNDITYVVASPLERAQETAAPTADAHAVDIVTDDRVIESENWFEGRRISKKDLLSPRNWHMFSNPRSPRGASPTRTSRERMLAAVEDARRGRASGHEAHHRLATSCQSGPCATSCRAAASGTTRASASAVSPR